MPEHFTRNTLECTSYCPQCKRDTQHRVDGGRRGPCIDLNHPVRKFSADQIKRKKQAEKDKQNPRLFE
jgi:ribosomal protein L44E